MDFSPSDTHSSADFSTSYFTKQGAEFVAESVVGIDPIESGVSSHTVGGTHKSIALPLIQAEAFISQRHEVNPAIALKRLQEIQTVVRTWQIQQRQIVQAMQSLYAQGPMIDGWLQSSLPTSAPLTAPANSTIFRHGDTEALMQYVEAMENSHGQMPHAVGSASVVGDAYVENADKTTSQYCLCSLSKDGTVRSHPCPPEQMATVSTAIARYQKFKQLIAQKQAVEAKLSQVVGGLNQVSAQTQA